MPQPICRSPNCFKCHTLQSAGRAEQQDRVSRPMTLTVKDTEGSIDHPNDSRALFGGTIGPSPRKRGKLLNLFRVH